MLNTVSRMRGQVKTVGYPQTEGILGKPIDGSGKGGGTLREWKRERHAATAPYFPL